MILRIKCKRKMVVGETVAAAKSAGEGMVESAVAETVEKAGTSQQAGTVEILEEAKRDTRGPISYRAYGEIHARIIGIVSDG